MSCVPGFTNAMLNRARLSRDARFDGKFFIAVLSTGIYCRPICPGPRCKRSNVAFYATAAAAQAAGYRPCRRCRPEVAPGSPAWIGPSAVVRRALRLIQEGTLDDATVEALANRVGLGARQLRRLFIEHVGVSPLAVAVTRRLQFARQLIDETPLSVTRVAMASGFRSLRRFNEAYRETFGCSPRESRRTPRGGSVAPAADQIALTLPYRPPYEWRQLCAFLEQRAIAGVERVDARGYARTVRLERGTALIRVAPIAGVHSLQLEVAGATPSSLFEIAATARRVFDLSADPAQIDSVLGSDSLLSRRVEGRPGLRIPGIWQGFECAVRALLGESIDRTAPQQLLERLVQRCGDSLDGPREQLVHLFPSSERLADADLEGIGMTSASAAAMRALARAAVEGFVDFLAPAETVARALEALPGFTREAVQYVMLRAIGDPDAYPLGNPAVAQERAKAWRPWRGYAALHLCQATAGGVATHSRARRAARS
jgi:AraC family transcriptional regulator, regulatory protein of adaptative response / DNA-3-methyladenine glycosylase II